LRGARLKPEQALYGLSPPKLAPEGIEPETFGRANSKMPSQPLGQLQMGSIIDNVMITIETIPYDLKSKFSRMEGGRGT